MERCDFSSVMGIITKYISESRNVSQLDLMFLVFNDFLASSDSVNFGFDNGLVCRWLK